MCWVMPPASPAATSVSRIASSSEVLPWSTWPMIVTTGGRALEVLGGVVELRLGLVLLGGADDLDLLVELVGEHLDGIVGQRLRERRHLAELHQLLDHVGDRDAQVLRDVLDGRAGVDLDDVGLEDADVLRHRLRVRAAPAPAAASRGPALRAAAGTAARAAGTAGAAAAACRLRVDHDAAHAAGRAGGALALERGARGASRGALVAAGGLVAVRLRLRLRRHPLRRAGAEVADAEIAGRAQLGARGRRLRALAVRVLRLLLAGERRVRRDLVHGRCRRLHGDAGSVQPLHHLGGGHVVLLR